jgi:hypothetical protein
MLTPGVHEGRHDCPIVSIRRRPPEPTRLSVVATRVRPRAKRAEFYALSWGSVAAVSVPRARVVELGGRRHAVGDEPTGNEHLTVGKERGREIEACDADAAGSDP